MGAAAVGAVAGGMAGSALANATAPSEKEKKAKEAEAAEKEAAELQRKADEARARAEAARKANKTKDAEAADKEAAELQRSAADRSLRAYRAGESGLSELLAVRRTLADALLAERLARSEALESDSRLRLDLHQMWDAASRERIVQALQASGLSREAYAELVRGRNEQANAVLDAALAEAAESTVRNTRAMRP